MKLQHASSCKHVLEANARDLLQLCNGCLICSSHERLPVMTAACWSCTCLTCLTSVGASMLKSSMKICWAMPWQEASCAIVRLSRCFVQPKKRLSTYTQHCTMGCNAIQAEHHMRCVYGSRLQRQGGVPHCSTSRRCNPSCLDYMHSSMELTRPLIVAASSL